VVVVGCTVVVVASPVEVVTGSVVVVERTVLVVWDPVVVVLGPAVVVVVAAGDDVVVGFGFGLQYRWTGVWVVDVTCRARPVQPIVADCVTSWAAAYEVWA
jgi:hypothetical protein